jgi:ATP-dependent Clp protease adaptor protein ClpS
MAVHDQSKTGIRTEHKEKISEPPFYKVLLHNDDYTTMEFVVMVLESVFHKSTMEATKIMLNVHNDGIGIAGIYVRDVAETKAKLVQELAKRYEHPLKCTVEKL